MNEPSVFPAHVSFFEPDRAADFYEDAFIINKKADKFIVSTYFVFDCDPYNWLPKKFDTWAAAVAYMKD